MLFRNQQTAPTVTYSVADMLAYRDTWTTGFPDLDVDAKLHPPPPEKGPKEPVKPLEVSKNAFKPTAVAELPKSEQLVRLVQATLNKLTDENFEALVPELLQPALFDPGVVDRFVEKIFDKSLEEPKYAPLYAEMCLRLAHYERSYMESGKAVRTSIINKAQEVYEKNRVASNSDEDAEKARKRKLSNIKFVGHLVHKELLALKIVHVILSSANDAPYPTEVNLEQTLVLADHVGSLMDARVDVYFKRLEQLLALDPFPYCNRVRFQIMNLIDLRRRGWVRPTIAEIDPAQPSDKPARSAGTFEGGNVAASLDKRPPMPPDMDPKQEQHVVKALLGMTPENVAEVLKSLSTVLKDHNPVINRATCMFYAINSACLAGKDGVTAEILLLDGIEPLELRAAQAWTAANSVASLVAQDCPKFYERFSSMLLAGLKDRTGYKSVMKDVLAVAATQIDAVYREYEGTVQWDEAYIAMWSSFVKASKDLAKSTPGVVPPLHEFLDCFSRNKMQGIAARTMTDVLTTLPDTGYCTYEDLKAWHQTHSKSQKLQHVLDAMSLLV